MTPTPTCRFGDRCELRTYEDAVECFGSHGERTKTEIALETGRLTGKSAGYIRSALSPNDGTHNLQLAIAPALFIASGGNPTLLLWLARACGYGVHRLPTAGGIQALIPALVDVNVATGDVTREVRAAMLDGLVTPAERQQIKLRALDTVAQLQELIAAVEFDAGIR